MTKAITLAQLIESVAVGDFIRFDTAGVHATKPGRTIFMYGEVTKINKKSVLVTSLDKNQYRVPKQNIRYKLLPKS